MVKNLQTVTRGSLKKELRVKSHDGSLGTIIECEDLHNVNVEYDTGGAGLYCFVDGCEDNSEIDYPLYVL